MITRTAAREIAVHYAFELSFSDLSAQALLEQELTPERFAEIAEAEPLYEEFPVGKAVGLYPQISDGCQENMDTSWMNTSENMPSDGNFSAFPGLRRLLCG